MFDNREVLVFVRDQKRQTFHLLFYGKYFVFDSVDDRILNLVSGIRTQGWIQRNEHHVRVFEVDLSKDTLAKRKLKQRNNTLETFLAFSFIIK